MDFGFARPDLWRKRRHIIVTALTVFLFVFYLYSFATIMMVNYYNNILVKTENK